MPFSPLRPLAGSRARPSMFSRINQSLRLFGAAVFFSLLCLPGSASAITAGGVHDFSIATGAAGKDVVEGGRCAGCHIPHGAVEPRLWPRNTDAGGQNTEVARRCMNCHDGSMPAEWPTYSGPNPPDPITSLQRAHTIPGADDDCSTCHGSHALDFAGRGRYTDCMCCHNRAADPTYADFELITDEPSNIIHSQHNIAYTSDACNYDTVEDYTVVECKKCHGPDKPSGDSYNDHPTATNFLVVRATFSNDPPTYYARNDVDKSAYEPFCLECHDGQNSGAIYQFSGPVPRSGGQPDQAPPTDPSDWTTTQPGPTWSVPAVPLGAGTPYFTNYAGSGNGHGRTTGVATGQNMGLTCLAGSSDGSIYGCHNAHSSQNRFLVDDFFGTDNVNWGDMMVATCYTTNHSDSNACHADLGDPGIGFHSWSSPRVLHDNSLQDVGKGERASDGMSLWRTNLPPSSSMTITTNTAITDVMPYFNDGGALNLASAQNEAHLRQNRVGAGNRISGEDWLTCMSCHDPHGTGALGGMLRDSDTDFSIQEPDYSHPLCAQCHD